MHGVVVLVKDNFATADKMQTTAGSLALIGSIVPRDAHVVQLLRKAGESFVLIPRVEALVDHSAPYKGRSSLVTRE